MTRPGFIMLRRGDFDQPLIRPTSRSPFCPGFAWVWLLEAAAWEGRRVDFGGRIVTLKRMI
jgi:hypothetical protein